MDSIWKSENVKFVGRRLFRSTVCPCALALSFCFQSLLRSHSVHTPHTHPHSPVPLPRPPLSTLLRPRPLPFRFVVFFSRFDSVAVLTPREKRKLLLVRCGNRKKTKIKRCSAATRNPIVSFGAKFWIAYPLADWFDPKFSFPPPANFQHPALRLPWQLANSIAASKR